MTIINPKSISGITSITTASGADNLFTVHTNNTTERIRINNDGDVIVGSGITVSPDGDIFATGVCTATSYYGDGSNLSNITSTTINSNADNRLITGSGTANTLNGESNLTFDGSTLSLTGNLKLPDNTSGNASIYLGTGDDFYMNHNGTNSFIINNTGNLYIRDLDGDVHIQGKDSEESIIAKADGAVELYYNNGKKLETSSAGATLTGTITCDGVTLGDNEVITIGNSSDMKIYHDSGLNYVGSYNAQSLVFYTDNTSRWLIQSDGIFRPVADNSYDIGTSSMRIRNIYTADIHCSNRGSKNDVDGTWGDYTIQEGESDLFLINNRNGKKYKFNLTEVS